MEVRALTTTARRILLAPFSRRTLSEDLYLFLTAPVACVVALASGLVAAGVIAYSMAVVHRPWIGSTLFFAGFGLVLAVVIGVPLLLMALPAARHLGSAHRVLAAAVLGEQVEAPPARSPGPGFRGWLRSSLGDPAGWRALLFLVVNAPVTLGGAFAVAMGTVIGLVTVAYPVWWSLADPENVGPDGVVHHSGMQLGEYYIESWPRALMVAGVGVVVLLAVPWVIRGTAGISRLLVRHLLGPGRAGRMTARVQDLEDTRAQAVDDSATTLRRIERDLHDGTQARLVALAMQLDMVRETLRGTGADGPSGDRERDVLRVLDLVDTAHRNAADAITELREVTRSIHPPALDRGLDAALATLAARAPVPTALTASIPSRPSAAIETIAYFCVAELLTNVAKHSGATRSTVEVSQDDDGRLHLLVGDDGRGGAEIGRAGAGVGGLAGLADRLRTVDGSLRVASPPGGPTVVTVELPPTSRSSRS
jgi:signal transduction histidine kinase